MTDLPRGWASATLGDVVEVVRGLTYKKEQARTQVEAGLAPLLRATNVQDGRLSLDDDLYFIPESLVRDEQWLRPGDIVVASSSGSSSVVGKSAPMHGEWRGTFGAFCTVLRPADQVAPRFVAHLVGSPAVRARWSELASGTNINNLKSSHITQTPVSLPPLNEQRRIVAAIEEHLSHLDAADASLEAGIRRADNLRRAVLEAVAQVEGQRVTTGKVAEVQGGIQKQPKRRPTTNRYPFLRVANVLRGRLDLTDVHEIELFEGEIERLALQPGDLLVVEGNGSAEQIGRSALWSGEIDPCVHQNHLIRVRPGSSLEPRFLDLFWNAPSTARRIAGVASSTSGLFTLSATKVKSVELTVPPLSEQRRIVAEIEERLSAIEALRAAIERAQRRSASLRRAILGRAFRGELVPQDPTDEPATALLERTRLERAAAPKQARPRRVSA